jgi:hypothetical protein
MRAVPKRPGRRKDAKRAATGRRSPKSIQMDLSAATPPEPRAEPAVHGPVNYTHGAPWDFED